MRATRRTKQVGIDRLNRKAIGGAQNMRESVVFGDPLGRRHTVLFVTRETIERAQSPDESRIKPYLWHADPVISSRPVSRHTNLAEKAAEEEAAIRLKIVLPRRHEEIVGAVQVEVVNEERGEGIVHDGNVGIFFAHR